MGLDHIQEVIVHFLMKFCIWWQSAKLIKSCTWQVPDIIQPCKWWQIHGRNCPVL